MLFRSVGEEWLRDELLGGRPVAQVVCSRKPNHRGAEEVGEVPVVSRELVQTESKALLELGRSLDGIERTNAWVAAGRRLFSAIRSCSRWRRVGSATRFVLSSSVVDESAACFTTCMGASGASSLVLGGPSSASLRGNGTRKAVGTAS